MKLKKNPGRLDSQKINNKSNDLMNFQASRTTSEMDSGLAQWAIVSASMRSVAERFMLLPEKADGDSP